MYISPAKPAANLQQHVQVGKFGKRSGNCRGMIFVGFSVNLLLLSPRALAEHYLLRLISNAALSKLTAQSAMSPSVFYFYFVGKDWVEDAKKIMEPGTGLDYAKER